MSGRVEIYRETTIDRLNLSERLGKWRWRYIRNGNIMADSGQGYSRRIDCIRGAETVLGGHFEEQYGCIHRGARLPVVYVYDLTKGLRP